MAVVRNELKYYINSADAMVLKSRLSHVLCSDSFTVGDKGYFVSSLYFEDPLLSSYWDKVNGIEKRIKYRIRYYNNDTGFLRLEKKEKCGQLIGKSSEALTLSEANMFCTNPFPSETVVSPLKNEFLFKTRREGFRPAVYVDYYRTAFCYPSGHVRITLDSDLKACRYQDGFSKKSLMMSAMDMNETILEIKFDSFLPPFISELLEDIPKNHSAISKFCKCYEQLF